MSSKMRPRFPRGSSVPRSQDALISSRRQLVDLSVRRADPGAVPGPAAVPLDAPVVVLLCTSERWRGDCKRLSSSFGLGLLLDGVPGLAAAVVVVEGNQQLLGLFSSPQRFSIALLRFDSAIHVSVSCCLSSPPGAFLAVFLDLASLLSRL
ncbi:hypothetical protein BDW74DRAFT_145202 [Aspergillus multicolor]|uniref:uncharacterized protein n=1 Tax=Aspergillus multicolor TaxID=41759 RepID=UPI003CCCB101